MTLEIAPATKSQLPAVLALYSLAGLDPGPPLPADEAEALFERIASYPSYRVFVALERGVAVGTFALVILDNLIHSGAPSALVEAVAVAPSHQGRGVGRSMMHHAAALAREAGCYKLTLSTNLSRERAHAFYEALGFEKHGYSYRLSL